MAYDPSSRADRSKAILAVAAVHFGMAAFLVLPGDSAGPVPLAQPVTQLIDIVIPPAPPPPEQPKVTAKRERDAGAEGPKAEPTPIVLPPPKLTLPPINPLPAAPVAGNGSAPSAGAGSTGIGPGAGGMGDGRGGGGAGDGEGGGIGKDARLLWGGINRRDYRYLRRYAVPGGRAMLAILIGPEGRVLECSTRQSSGDRALDSALCQMLQQRMHWAPARDRRGRPITVGILYTAVWSRD